MRSNSRYEPINLFSALQSKTTIVQQDDPGPSVAPLPRVDDTSRAVSDSKDREILRLQRTLTEAKTTNRARESQLRVAKEGLKDAREALNETFAEYTGVREELKTVKQALGRDHQAIVYRKDIELFALRKINEQREKNLNQRDAQLEEMERQHRATLEVKEEQLRMLRDRVAVMELSGGAPQEKDDGDHALEVRLLKVKKGRTSLEAEDEKDAIILQLQDELAVAKRSAEAVVNQQAELQRAWDITKKIQAALKEERDRHTKTREQLEDVRGETMEKVHQEGNSADSGRLPTIAEHDRGELEAMFDAAQKDNSDLNNKVIMLEKRLRDANARLFSAAQESEALRDQVRFEQAKKHELESERRNMAHQVHLQRMEAELRDAQDMIAAKDEEIRQQTQSMSDVDRYVGRLRREIDAAIRFHTEDQEEIETLKQTVSELERSKSQLMAEREQQASQPTRPRITSADPDSARSSDAPTIAPVEALPPMPFATESTSRGRAQSASTPTRPSALSNMVSSDEPAVQEREVKSVRRTSLGLRDMMKKITRKDDQEEPAADAIKEAKVKQFDRARMKNALSSMTPSALSRPSTATAASSVPATPIAPVTRKPAPATAPVPEKMRSPRSRRNSMRYYATPATKDERPQTAASKEVKTAKHKSWGTNVQTKLKRRSLY
ncbi:hypothetical protein NX059_001368 [Plenodomus lindquistii]|nr:hypothetical protein NX059_001368 [Plenodomus lindquistii]